MNNNNENNQCCPEFNPEKWDKRTISWDNKKFIKDSLPTIFHMPFPPMIGKKITRMWGEVEKAEAAAPNKEDTLILFRDPSAFKSEIYISVEKDVPMENNVFISGNFVSRVFDGDYNAIPKFVKIMDEYLAETGKEAKDYYVHYAYCPICAKKFEHNYIILFAKV
jgi:hypothetical protein